MIKRTHLAIGIALALYFLPWINHKLFFVPVVIIASILPDIDSATSTLGRKAIFKPVQIFMTHRGPMHSYTMCVLLSTIFAFFFPIIALPFFFGYSFHLFADSFTLNGIRPFWPLKFSTGGIVKTGGMIDKAIFFVFLIIDVFLISTLFSKV